MFILFDLFRDSGVGDCDFDPGCDSEVLDSGNGSDVLDGGWDSHVLDSGCGDSRVRDSGGGDSSVFWRVVRGVAAPETS
jgi:hypothetical protein